MALTDQLDFTKPEHVSVCTNGNQLIVYIKGITSSVKLTYQLERECTYSDSVPNEVTYRGPNFCTPPLPPLQQLIPHSWIAKDQGEITSK